MKMHLVLWTMLLMISSSGLMSQTSNEMQCRDVDPVSRKRCMEMTSDPTGLCLQHLEDHRNENAQQTKGIQHRKSPGLATFLSFMFPGGGQFYNGQGGKGIGFIVLYGLGTGLMYYDLINSVSTYTYDYYNGGTYNKPNYTLLYVGLGIDIVAWIWSMADASSSAKKINIQNEKRSGTTFLMSPYINNKDVGMSFQLKF